MTGIKKNMGKGKRILFSVAKGLSKCTTEFIYISLKKKREKRKIFEW